MGGLGLEGPVSRAERSGVSPGNTQSGDRPSAGRRDGPRPGIVRDKPGSAVVSQLEVKLHRKAGD